MTGISKTSSLLRSYLAEDIVQLQMDTPGKGANVITGQFLDELEEHLCWLQGQSGLAGLVLTSAKPRVFLAGADLQAIASTLDWSDDQIIAFCRRGQVLFEQLGQLPLVSVAAIRGVCLGGGLELSLAHDFRVAEAQAQLGVPEVKLGLIPGWAGTVRLPRMIGLEEAVELVTSGRVIDAQRALQLGLVDQVAPADQLVQCAVQRIRGDAVSGPPAEHRRSMQGAVARRPADLAEFSRRVDEAIARRSSIHPEAPRVALHHMVDSADLSLQQASIAEAAAMTRVYGSPANAGLLNAFFLDERLKKDPGIDIDLVKQHRVQRLGLIGLGQMGQQIAQVSLRAGIPVVVLDADRAKVQQFLGLMEQHAKGEALGASFGVAQSLADFAPCDLVLESIVESLGVKLSVLGQLETQLAPQAMIASNTSSLRIGKIAAGLQRPERFCGVHFCHPLSRRNLVEVIPSPTCAEATVAKAVRFAQQIGKFPVVVADVPAFAINRMLSVWIDEAIRLLSLGITIDAIDSAASEFGYLDVPFRVIDGIGLDTVLYAARGMLDDYPHCLTLSPILPKLIKAGRLGDKTGCGFYRADADGESQVDAQATRLVAPYMRQPPERLSPADIQLHLLLPMVQEATRLLAERTVRDHYDIDFISIHGCAFPRFRGGLLYWADTLGAAQILKHLQRLDIQRRGMEPTPMLQDMAARGGRFYG